MAHKTHDIVAKVGEYTDRQGNTKARYENVGALMQGDNGPFIMMKRTFNLAGLPQDGRDNALLSCFEPRDDQQGGNRGQQSGNARQASYDAQRPSGAPAGGASSGNHLPGYDDEVPFAPCVLL